MSHTRFLSERCDNDAASDWVESCALSAGWSIDEASRLAICISESARSVSERAYRLKTRGPVFLKLDMTPDMATLELHHEGALGDQPCNCAAAQVASERISSNWKDAQLRTHRMTIARA